jgi:hypothetical protein
MDPWARIGAIEPLAPGERAKQESERAGSSGRFERANVLAYPARGDDVARELDGYRAMADCAVARGLVPQECADRVHAAIAQIGDATDAGDMRAMDRGYLALARAMIGRW